ncbi:MAG: hypothetical protein V4487_06315 [Chlamydiota bacterium]
MTTIINIQFSPGFDKYNEKLSQHNERLSSYPTEELTKKINKLKNKIYDINQSIDSNENRIVINISTIETNNEITIPKLKKESALYKVLLAICVIVIISGAIFGGWVPILTLIGSKLAISMIVIGAFFLYAILDKIISIFKKINNIEDKNDFDISEINDCKNNLKNRNDELKQTEKLIKYTKAEISKRSSDLSQLNYIPSSRSEIFLRNFP